VSPPPATAFVSAILGRAPRATRNSGRGVRRALLTRIPGRHRATVLASERWCGEVDARSIASRALRCTAAMCSRTSSFDLLATSRWLVVLSCRSLRMRQANYFLALTLGPGGTSARVATCSGPPRPRSRTSSILNSPPDRLLLLIHVRERRDFRGTTSVTRWVVPHLGVRRGCECI
jgi:hypothetical protein